MGATLHESGFEPVGAEELLRERSLMQRASSYGQPLFSRNRADLLEMFKMLIGKSSPKFESLFERSTLLAARGHSVKLVKHRCKLDLRKYFFCERMIDRWNQLSEDCVSCVTVNSFKGKLDMVRQKKMGFFEDHT